MFCFPRNGHQSGKSKAQKAQGNTCGRRRPRLRNANLRFLGEVPRGIPALGAQLKIALLAEGAASLYAREKQHASIGNALGHSISRRINLKSGGIFPLAHFRLYRCSAIYGWCSYKRYGSMTSRKHRKRYTHYGRQLRETRPNIRRNVQKHLGRKRRTVRNFLIRFAVSPVLANYYLLFVRFFSL